MSNWTQESQNYMWGKFSLPKKLRAKWKPYYSLGSADGQIIAVLERNQNEVLTCASYCICLYQDAIGTPPFEPESFSSNGEADNVEAYDKSNFGNRKDKKAEIM